MFSAIAKTFRGERPLWETYWLWGALPSAVLDVSMKVSMPLLIEHALDRPNLPTIAYYGFTCIWGAFVVFFAGAVWRSSASYKGSRVWAVLARVVVVLAVISLLGALIPSTPKSDDNRVITEDRLAQDAKTLNKGLPQKVSDYLQLASVSADRKTLTYHFSVTNMTENELLSDYADRLRSAVVKGRCDNSEARAMLRQGVTLVSEYSMAGRVLVTVKTTAQDCPQ